MSSYDSMAGAMSAVGAYSLDGTTYVDSELEVYAEELDALSEEIGLIIRECIVATAENEGLRFYETLVGALDSNLSTEKRREMIISLMHKPCKGFSAVSFDLYGGFQNINVGGLRQHGKDVRAD